MKKLTHLDSDNQPNMVDISDKSSTLRSALAQSIVTIGSELMSLLEDGDIQSKKGPVFHTAIIAATMAAKNTHQLIPFCHPIPLEKCKVQIHTFVWNESDKEECRGAMQWLLSPVKSVRPLSFSGNLCPKFKSALQGTQ